MIGDHRLVFTCMSLLTDVRCGALRDRRALLLENLLLKQQLAVALRSRRRPDVRWHDRLFWVVAHRLCADWRRHFVLVHPETVLRWHRRGWRLFWWWRPRRPAGRPRLTQEVRALIRGLPVLQGTNVMPYFAASAACVTGSG